MDVDVVIPMRNGEQYIVRALKSIASQTIQPINVIVVDDGSDDFGPDLVKEFSVSSFNLILISTKHIGLSAARNLGIRSTKSELVALLDCDDYWSPKKLENQVNFLKNTPLAQVVFSNCFIYHDSLAKIENAINNNDSFFSFKNIVLQRYRVVGSASSICLKKILFSEIGFFNEKIEYGEDYDLWIRIAAKHKIYEIPDRDVYITKRENSMQSEVKTGLDAFRNSLMYFDVWHRNKIEFLQYKPEFSRLIWPDIRTNVFRSPQNLKLFFREIKDSYPEKYFQFFGTLKRQISFFVILLSQDVISKFVITLQKFVLKIQTLYKQS